MNSLILESHFTGTSNLDTVTKAIDLPVIRKRAFERDLHALHVCAHRFQHIDKDVSRAPHYGSADIIIGAPPADLYTCK